MEIPKGAQFLFVAVPMILIAGILMFKFVSKDNNEVQSFTDTNQEALINTGDTMTDIDDFSFETTKEGTGPAVLVGDTVSVNYSGTLTDGTKFDSSYDRGVPFEFTVGQGQVIRGWDEGIKGMKVGEKRTLYIPSSMGYGSNGAGDLIPSYAGLIFEVELMEIK